MRLSITSASITPQSGGQKLKIAIGGIKSFSLFTSINSVASFAFNFNDRSDFITREHIKAGDKLRVTIKDEDSDKTLSLNLVISKMEQVSTKSLATFYLLRGFDEANYNLMTKKGEIIFNEPTPIKQMFKKLIPDLKTKSAPTNTINQITSNASWTKMRMIRYLQTLAVTAFSKDGNDCIIYQDILDEMKMYISSFEYMKKQSPKQQRAYVIGDQNKHYKWNILSYKLNEKSFPDSTKSLRYKNLEIEYQGFDFAKKETLKSVKKTKSDDEKTLKKFASKKVPKAKLVDSPQTFNNTGAEHILQQHPIFIDILLQGTLDKDLINLGDVINISFKDIYKEGDKLKKLNGKYILSKFALHVLPQLNESKIKARLNKI